MTIRFSIRELPPESLDRLINYLDYAALCAMKLTSKEWERFATQLEHHFLNRFVQTKNSNAYVGYQESIISLSSLKDKRNAIIECNANSLSRKNLMNPSIIQEMRGSPFFHGFVKWCMDRALKEPGTEKTSWRPSWLSSAVSVVETPPLVSVPVIEAAALPADEAVSVGQFSLLTRNLLQIVANLDLQSLAAMSRTSRQWNNFIRRTEILEHHCINHFIDDVSRQWLNIGQTRWQSPELREILAKKNLAEKQNMLSDFFARFENIYFPPWKGVPLIENLAGEYYRRRFGPSNQGQTSSQNRLAHSEPESIDSLACSVPKGRDSIPCEAPLGTPDSTSSHDSQISELLNEIILKTQNPNLAPVKQFVAIDNLELKRKIFFEKCMTDRVIAKYKAIPMFEKLVADYSEK